MALSATAEPAAGTLEIPTIALRELLPWLLFAVVAAAFVTYFVGGSALLHETVHDGRHLLGYPCH